MITETSNQSHLREKVRQLADRAFHRHLISGHGDGEYEDKYQIVIEGKPRHYPLNRVFYVLQSLLKKTDRN